MPFPFVEVDIDSEEKDNNSTGLIGCVKIVDICADF